LQSLGNATPAHLLQGAVEGGNIEGQELQPHQARILQVQRGQTILSRYDPRIAAEAWVQKRRANAVKADIALPPKNRAPRAA
jgi:hypothetical protein